MRSFPNQPLCFRRAVCRSLACFGVLLFVLSFPARLRAQALSGITGTITDATGAVVPGATVTITNVATQVSKSAVTSSSGTYNIVDLNPGKYTLKVEAHGFTTSIHNDVGIEVSKVSTVDAILQPGNTATTVEVKADLVALNTENPQQATTIEPQLVEALPLQISGGRGRQIDSFLFLAPGVTGNTFSHRINGGVDFQNEVLFNGVVAVQSETAGYQTNINPPYEMVDQFSVLRDTFSAQYGLAQGAASYRFASGTNELHGDGFEILRNNFFDARGAYNPTTPIDRENNWGFSLGGPVYIPKVYNGKNKTFFFVTSEWYRQNLTQTGFMTVPTPAMKTGDFSHFVDSTGALIPIYNPVNSKCTANGNTPGTPFAGNIIPAACISANSSSLLGDLPDPNLPGFTNNLSSQITSVPNTYSNWGYTIDQNISDKQSIHWSEWRDKAGTFGIDNNALFSGVFSGLKNEPRLGTGFFLTYSNSFSPNLIMTAGAGWMGELNFEYNSHLGSDFPNISAASTVLPRISFINGPYTPNDWGAGNAGETFSINRKLGLSFDNNWLWVHGNQTFNIGVEVRRSYQDDHECQACVGQITFSAFTTGDPASFAANPPSTVPAPGTTGSAFASFLLGDVDSANRNLAPELRLRNLDISPYIQDDIKLSPRLTLNVGVRWDIMRPFTEVNNNIVFFDPNIPNPAAGGRLGAATKFGNCAGCAGYDRADIKWDHLSPRLGFAYELNNKTVLQGGFSVNFLNGGAYEYGTSKVAVSYGNLLNGSVNVPSNNSNIPAYGFWDGNPLAAPAALPFGPGIGTGNVIHEFNKNDGITPYLMAWNIGIQRELPYNMFFSGAYVANRAVHLPSQLNPTNEVPVQDLQKYGSLLGQPFGPAAIAAGIPLPYPGFTGSVQQALRPYPQYVDIVNNFDMTGGSRYNAMQLELEKRFSEGLSFLVTYNLSRMMSNTNSGFTIFGSRPLNKQNQGAEWTVDNNDQTHMVNIVATYELPFGPGKPMLNTKNVLGQVLGGWQISPILTYQSGTPLWTSSPGGTISVPNDPLGNCPNGSDVCGPGNDNRANVIPGVPQFLGYGNVYKGLPVINAAAFSNPGFWVLGNAPRVLSGLRNPWYFNENVALVKKFFLGSERFKAELRMEYFNLLNRVQFGSPDLNLTDPNFGLVINSQANTQRQGQAQFRLTF
ncbi:MAG: TonB-dependent receptor [Acidobacteriaceae bacterium]|nr:TonB-dependent receptor [Acidobacteriaceae bacterium]MBV9782101.1 TonB-dependent receptor [Acidobacteriaceae bacterium]